MEVLFNFTSVKGLNRYGFIAVDDGKVCKYLEGSIVLLVLQYLINHSSPEDADGLVFYKDFLVLMIRNFLKWNVLFFQLRSDDITESSNF